jgi:hypothetical protein
MAFLCQGIEAINRYICHKYCTLVFKSRRSLWGHAWCHKNILYQLLKVIPWIFPWNWFFFKSPSDLKKQPHKIVQILMRHPVDWLWKNPSWPQCRIQREKKSYNRFITCQRPILNFESTSWMLIANFYKHFCHWKLHRDFLMNYCENIYCRRLELKTKS